MPPRVDPLVHQAIVVSQATRMPGQGHSTQWFSMDHELPTLCQTPCVVANCSPLIAAGLTR